MNFEFIWTDTQSFCSRIKYLISNGKLDDVDQEVLYELGQLALNPKSSEILEDKLSISTDRLYLSLAHLEYLKLIHYSIDIVEPSTVLA